MKSVRKIGIYLLVAMGILSGSVLQASDSKHAVAKGRPAPGGIALPAVPREPSALTFSGIVEPGRTFRLILNPGEVVRELRASVGEIVEKDDLLVRLTNDSLDGARFDLLSKRKAISGERQQMRLSEMEREIKNKQLAEIERRLQEELRLGREVEGYFSPTAVQLAREKQGLEGELKLLAAGIDMQKESLAALEELDLLLGRQLAEVDKRSKKLYVRAPFRGRVVYVSREGTRTPPGGVLCEVWSEESFLVKGRIMQHQLKYLQPGDEVSISLDFSDGRPVKGRVERIEQNGMQMESKGGYPSFEVSIKVESPDEWIRSGMLVSIQQVSGADK